MFMTEVDNDIKKTVAATVLRTVN